MVAKYPTSAGEVKFSAFASAAENGSTFISVFLTVLQSRTVHDAGGRSNAVWLHTTKQSRPLKLAVLKEKVVAFDDKQNTEFLFTSVARSGSPNPFLAGHFEGQE